jgi:hypothetical protein
MGRRFMSARMGAKEVSARWFKARGPEEGGPHLHCCRHKFTTHLCRVGMPHE